MSKESDNKAVVGRWLAEKLDLVLLGSSASRIAVSPDRWRIFTGVVTLSKRRREAGLLRGTSSGRDDLAPRGHRRGAKRAVRLGRGEMALDVKDVVDGGVGLRGISAPIERS
jgi:hypothetical protein